MKELEAKQQLENSGHLGSNELGAAALLALCTCRVVIRSAVGRTSGNLLLDCSDPGCSQPEAMLLVPAHVVTMLVQLMLTTVFMCVLVLMCVLMLVLVLVLVLILVLMPVLLLVLQLLLVLVRLLLVLRLVLPSLLAGP